MTFKNIVVFVDPTPASVYRLRIAAEFAHRFEAHLIGVYVVPGNLEHHSSDAFVRGTEAIRTLSQRYRAAGEKAVLEVGRQFAELVDSKSIQAEFRIVWNGDANNNVIHNSLYADLILTGPKEPDGLSHNWLPERLLVASGVPLLVVPNGWTRDEIGWNIVIAWNATKEARRAVSDALPLLSTARTVKILIVDPASYPDRHGEEPGATIAMHLARHGAKVTVEQVQADGSPAADIILKSGIQNNADLVIMGAYSHSRPRQALFGSVTRAVLKDATFPVFLSR